MSRLLDLYPEAWRARYGAEFLALLAVGAQRAGLWPAWMPALLVACVVVPLIVALIQLMLPWYALRQAGFPFWIIIAPISGLWLVYGIGLLRGFSTPTQVRP
jgi:hypothetical protein